MWGRNTLRRIERTRSRTARSSSPSRKCKDHFGPGAGCPVTNLEAVLAFSSPSHPAHARARVAMPARRVIKVPLVRNGMNKE